jgi:hypothetical protein
MRIATGEVLEERMEDSKNKAAVELGRRGGVARAKSLDGVARMKIAKKAAQARWKKKR